MHVYDVRTWTYSNENSNVIYIIHMGDKSHRFMTHVTMPFIYNNILFYCLINSFGRSLDTFTNEHNNFSH